MGITPQEMLKIRDDFKKAQEDTTPHVGVANDEMFVIGDATKTENKKHDYTAVMRYPREWAEYVPKDSIVDLKQGYVMFEMEFKNVFIKPRNDIKVIANIAQVLPFFEKLNDDGGITDYTNEELIQLALDVDQEILDGIYAIIAAFLDIDTETSEHIMWQSALGLMSAFMRDFPEAFNEADFSLGLPTERA